MAHAQVLVPTINGRGYHLEDIRTRGVWRVPDDATSSEVEAIEASQLAELHALLDDLGQTWDLEQVPLHRDPYCVGIGARRTTCL